MKQIFTIWNHFLEFFEKKDINREELGFRDGADVKEIMNVEKLLGVKLPDDFRDFLRICNGQEYGNDHLHWLPDGMRLLGIEEIYKEWEYQTKIFMDVPDALDGFETFQNDDKIRAIVFHEKWIPIAMLEGSCWIFFDYVPGPKGTEAQLIFNLTECDFIVLSNSFTELVQHYITSLQAGTLIIEKDPDYHDGYSLKTRDKKHIDGNILFNI